MTAAEVENSREQFLRVADLLPEPMLLVRGDGTIIAANAAVRSRLNREPRELVDQPLEELLVESILPASQFLRSCSRSRTLVPGSLVLSGSGGQPVRYRAEGAVFRPRSGSEPSLILLRLIPNETAASRFVALTQRADQLAREINRRKRFEEALREQHEWLRVILTGIGDAVIATDEDGRISLMNPVAVDLTGWAEAEARGQPLESVFRIYNEHTRDPVENPVDKVLASGAIVGLANHTVLVARDGTERPIDDSAAPIRSDDGRLIGVVLVFRDVSDRRQRERHRQQLLAREQTARWRAEEARERLAYLIEASGTLTGNLDPPAVLASILDVARRLVPADAYAVWRLHPDRNQWLVQAAVGLSDAFQQTVIAMSESTPGMPRTPIIAEDVTQIPMLEERQQAYQTEGIRSIMVLPLRLQGEVAGTLAVYHRQSHRFDEMEVRIASAVANLASAVIGMAELYAEQSRLQRELRQRVAELSEADRRKNEFLALLAHELRNPMAPIRSAVEIMKIARDDITVEEARAVLERQVRHLVRLVDDLLDVSRITRGLIELRRERVDLAGIIEHAVETSRPQIEEHGHSFSVHGTAEPLVVDADVTRLMQVISNLLNNAARYTPAGGRIELEAARIENEAVIRVRDNGIGIPAEMLSRVFEMFAQVDASVQRAQGGLGIGLTIVQRMVELHGGRVEARSPGPNQGSEFVVYLPLAAAADTGTRAANVSQTPAAHQAPQAALQILIADDNADAARSLATLLEILGHHVRVASDGAQALGAFLDQRPDLAILDIGMPGLTGYEVAREIRRSAGNRDVLLAALTGWGQHEDRRRSEESGFNFHLVKPVELDQLNGILQAAAARIRPLRQPEQRLESGD